MLKGVVWLCQRWDLDCSLNLPTIYILHDMSDVDFIWRMSHILYRPSIGANAMGDGRSTVVKDNVPRTTDRSRSCHKPTSEKSWLNALVGNKTTDFSLLQLPARKLNSALLGWKGKYKECTVARHHIRLRPSECIGLADVSTVA